MHLIEKRDIWGNRLGLWIVVLMAFVTPLCWWSMRQFRLENDIERWIPETDLEHRTLQWAHTQFPIEERILVSWDDSSINDPRIDKLIERLVGKPDSHGIRRGGVPYVLSVTDPRHELDVMQRNGVDVHEAVRRLEGTVLGAGTLRLKLTETGHSAIRKTKRELQTAMLARYGVELGILDASPDLTPLVCVAAPMIEGETPADPSSPTVLLPNGTIAANPSVEHDLQVAWKGMRIGSESTIAMTKWLTEYVPQNGDGNPLVESCFFVPGVPVALAVGISESGLADKSETVTSIRSACLQAGIPDESLHLAGSAVTATELNHEVLKAIWDPSFPLVNLHRRSVILTSALVSALFAFALVRNLRLATIVVFVSLFTTVCSLAIVPVVGGSMNMILIVLSPLLTVLTMSGAIHVANYWKHAACKDVATAIARTVRMSWKPSFPASLTVAIGFLALCTSHLVPLRDLGIFAAVGTGLSLLAVVYVMPSLMQLWPGQAPKPQELDHSAWRMFGQLLTVRSGWQSLAVIAICIGCSLGLSKMRTETKIVRYFPNRAAIARDYSWIETRLSGVMPVETIVRFDQQSQRETNFLDRMELIREIQNAMRVHPEVTGSISLADFQPITERPPEDAGFLVRTKFNKRAAATEQRIRDGEISTARSYYTVSEAGRDLNDVGDGKLNQPGDELWRITAQVNVMTDNDLGVVTRDLHRITQEVLKLQPGSHHFITGAVPLFVRIQQAVLATLISSLLLASLLIMGVVMIMLRSIGGGFVAMIPNVAPIAVVFGIMSWMGERIEIGSMIAASVSLGIAVEGALHYLTWVRWAMKNGRTRHEAVVDALVHCGPTMCQTCAVVAIGLVALAPAELLLISRFGVLMAALIGVALLGDIVMLPLLVAGPLGWLFEPSNKNAFSVDATQISGVDSLMTSMSDQSVVPPPHAVPGETPAKKRRASTRRQRDAG